ncbi:DUF1259 domain-containing protein [Neobacillus driksii]
MHNHWLFENPRLMYIHFEKIEPHPYVKRQLSGSIG